MKLRIALLLFVTVTGVLWGCKDKDLPPASSLTTPLMAINATADTVNYYLNGTRQNNLSALYPNGWTTYTNTITGQQNYQFKQSSNGAALFAKQFTLDSGKYYSLFLGGVAADDVFITEDKLAAAAATLAADTTDTTHLESMMRFVNVAKGSGLLTVKITNSDTVRVSFTDIDFKGFTDFKMFTSTAKRIRVYNPGGELLKDSVVTFQTGSIYTLFTKGKFDGTGDSAFGMALITNK